VPCGIAAIIEYPRGFVFVVSALNVVATDHDHVRALLTTNLEDLAGDLFIRDGVLRGAAITDDFHFLAVLLALLGVVAPRRVNAESLDGT
jgi:hypothetical protein